MANSLDSSKIVQTHLCEISDAQVAYDGCLPTTNEQMEESKHQEEKASIMRSKFGVFFKHVRELSHQATAAKRMGSFLWPRFVKGSRSRMMPIVHLRRDSSLNRENVFVNFSNTNGDSCHHDVSFVVALVLPLEVPPGLAAQTLGTWTRLAVMPCESAIEDVTGLTHEFELAKVTETPCYFPFVKVHRLSELKRLVTHPLHSFTP